MAQHIVTGIVPPATAPTDVGMHYIDTAAKRPYFSVGTSSAADWLALAVVPVGAVLAWLKSLTGTSALPADFLECNGQTISDAASPLNGQTLPNLNGNHQFLRGNSTSGGTGGASTHAHLYDGSTSVEDGDTDVQSDSGAPATVSALGHVHSFGGTTDTASSLPPCTDVVWIIRVK